MASCNRSSLCGSAIEEELLRESPSESSESEYSSDSDTSQDEECDLNMSELVSNKSGDIFSWEGMDNYVGKREVLTGNHGPQNEAKYPLDIISIFKLFFDHELISLIVHETNRYADQFMVSRGMLFSFRSRVREWKPVSSDEIYVVLGLYILMGIVQKPTFRSYFSRNGLIQTPIFSSVISLDRFESINRFIHFVDNELRSKFVGPKKLFKIFPVVTHLNEKFKKYYLPEQNISIDESLTLWKGRLSFKQYIPLKAAKFGIKTFELCESSTSYLWSFIVYTGKDTLEYSPVAASVDNKTSEVVLHLITPLLHKGHTLWMDNYYNSPTLANTLKNLGTDCVGTLRLNRKNVPRAIRDTKLKRGENIALHSGSISIVKWMDKKPVSMISTYHNNVMKTVTTRSKQQIEKPITVIDYNKSMGGVDLKDQFLQMHLVERKRNKKWNVKMFKRLLNITVLNSFIIWKKNHPGMRADHLKFRVSLIEQIFLEHSKLKKENFECFPDYKPERLTGRHFIERIPPTGSKAKQQKRCVVCHKNGRRKEPVYWCPDCKVGLCPDSCFKDFHTKENY